MAKKYLHITLAIGILSIGIQPTLASDLLGYPKARMSCMVKESVLRQILSERSSGKNPADANRAVFERLKGANPSDRSLELLREHISNANTFIDAHSKYPTNGLSRLIFYTCLLPAQGKVAAVYAETMERDGLQCHETPNTDIQACYETAFKRIVGE